VLWLKGKQFVETGQTQTQPAYSPGWASSSIPYIPYYLLLGWWKRFVQLKLGSSNRVIADAVVS
jgi:hypothetical protein